MTYSELADRVQKLASGFVNCCGLKRGDRVGIAMTNCPAFTEVLYAIWHAGLVAVPMNAKLHQREISYIIKNAGVRLRTPKHLFDEVVFLKENYKIDSFYLKDFYLIAPRSGEFFHFRSLLKRFRFGFLHHFFYKRLPGLKNSWPKLSRKFPGKKPGVRNSRENISGVIDIFSEMKYFRGD